MQEIYFKNRIENQNDWNLNQIQSNPYILSNSKFHFTDKILLKIKD